MLCNKLSRTFVKNCCRGVVNDVSYIGCGKSPVLEARPGTCHSIFWSVWSWPICMHRLLSENKKLTKMLTGPFFLQSPLTDDVAGMWSVVSISVCVLTCRNYWGTGAIVLTLDGVGLWSGRRATIYLGSCESNSKGYFLDIL